MGYTTSILQVCVQADLVAKPSSGSQELQIPWASSLDQLKLRVHLWKQKKMIGPISGVMGS